VSKRKATIRSTSSPEAGSRKDQTQEGNGVVDEDLTLEAMRSVAEELRARLPGLAVVEEAPTKEWKVTRLHFTPPGATAPALTVASGSHALDVHFGSGLVLEAGARTLTEAQESVAFATELIRAIAREGFTEHLWIRDGRVLAAETEVPLSSGLRRFRRRDLATLRRTSRAEIVHEPW
jgi:hypothetical protein